MSVSWKYNRAFNRVLGVLVLSPVLDHCGCAQRDHRPVTAEKQFNRAASAAGPIRHQAGKALIPPNSRWLLRFSTRSPGEELQRLIAAEKFHATLPAKLDAAEDAWHAIFKQEGLQYREPKLVLFDGAVQSACGMGQAAMGPFYCPGDQKVYIDLSFYRDLKERFRAPGDFAQAYVIAHEVGHHVQTLLGVSEKVQQAKRRASREEANAIQVKMELQADCLAGVWANYANRKEKILEAGDVAEAMAAAEAIGDDTIQGRSSGRVRPETFTHGTAAQRQRWFNAGLESGCMNACDTFSARRL